MVDEIAFAMKSCFAGLYLDGFDFIQGLALGFHLNEVKISLNQQKKSRHIRFLRLACLLFLFVIGVWA